jgi:hypothetical protein
MPFAPLKWLTCCHKFARLSSHLAQQLRSRNPRPLSGRRCDIRTIPKRMAMPACQLSAAVIQGLEIPFVCARALQEGPYTAFQALDGYNVHHPLPTAQEDRQACPSKHSNGPHFPVVKDERRRPCGLRGSHQLWQVHLECIFEDRDSGRFGFFHRQYLKDKRTGHLHARFMVGLWIRMRQCRDDGE